MPSFGIKKTRGIMLACLRSTRDAGVRFQTVSLCTSEGAVCGGRVDGRKLSIVCLSGRLKCSFKVVLGVHGRVGTFSPGMIRYRLEAVGCVVPTVVNLGGQVGCFCAFRDVVRSRGGKLISHFFGGVTFHFDRVIPVTLGGARLTGVGGCCSVSSAQVVPGSVSMGECIISRSVQGRGHSSLGVSSRFMLKRIKEFSLIGGRSFVLTIFYRLVEMGGGSGLLLIKKKDLLRRVGDGIMRLKLLSGMVFTNSYCSVPSCVRTVSTFVFPSLCRNLKVITVRTRTSSLPYLTSSGIPERIGVAGLLRFRSLGMRPRI